MYKLHKMIIQVLMEIWSKNPLPAPDFDPTPIQLEPSCQGMTVLIGICISLSYHFAAIDGQYSQDLTYSSFL